MLHISRIENHVNPVVRRARSLYVSRKLQQKRNKLLSRWSFAVRDDQRVWRLGGELLGWVLNYLLRRPPCNSLSITIMISGWRGKCSFEIILISLCLPCPLWGDPGHGCLWGFLRGREQSRSWSLSEEGRRCQEPPGMKVDINWTFWFFSVIQMWYSPPAFEWALPLY